MKHSTIFVYIVIAFFVFTNSLNAKGDRPKCNDELVISAIFDNDAVSLSNCLKQGYPVSGYGKTGIGKIMNEPAYWAIFENRLKIVQILIDHGLDVNYDWGKNHGNLMVIAVQFGTKEMVELLLKNGCSPNRDPQFGGSPLYRAFIYQKKPIEILLLENGAQLNSWDKDALDSLGVKYKL